MPDHILHRAVSYDFSLHEHADHVATVGLAQVVRADEHRHSRRRKFGHGRPELLAGWQVKTGGWLIEQQKARRGHKGSSELRPPHPASGKPSHPLARETLQTVLVEQSRDSPPRIGDTV